MRCDELVSKSQVFFEILMSYGEIVLIRVIYLECLVFYGSHSRFA